MEIFCFAKAEDLGIDFVHVFKVKAHRSIKSSENMYDSLKILGNARADVLAKLAARRHPWDGDLYQRICDQKLLIVQNAKYIARVSVAHVDKFPRIEDLKLLPRSSGPSAQVSDAAQHSFAKLSNGRFRCSSCFANSSDGKLASKCTRDALSLGHRIWVLEHIQFCVLCGSYSIGRLGKLMVACPGKPTTDHLVRSRSRLLSGVHPVSQAPLGSPVPDFPVSKGHDPLGGLLEDLLLQIMEETE